MSVTQEILLNAADLIESTGHCRFALAVDAKGEALDAFSPEAVAYCGRGAILATADRAGVISWLNPHWYADLAARAIGCQGLIDANDNYGAEVTVSILRSAATVASDIHMLCQYCKAWPGEPCRTRGGAIRKQAHKVRVNLNRISEEVTATLCAG